MPPIRAPAEHAGHDAPDLAEPARAGGAGRFVEVTLHLARRELEARHQLTLLGWAWPLVRQLAQLAVLVFVFSTVFDLDVEDFPAFVFVGLLAWNWFSGALNAGTASVLARRHLVFQAQIPPAAVPAAAVAAGFIDVVIAAPVLLAMLVAYDALGAGLLLVPLALLVQLALLLGLAWLLSAGSVFLRDIPNVVGVVVAMLFYVTPVFYGVRAVPEQYAPVFQLNPVAVLIESYRAMLLGEPWPQARFLVIAAVVSAALALLGHRAFRSASTRFADHL